MNASKTNMDFLNNGRKRDDPERTTADAVRVAADVLHGSGGDVGNDKDRECCANVLWIRAEDLVALGPPLPPRPAPLGQRDHDNQQRGQGDDAPGATAPRRSRRAATPARKRGGRRGSAARMTSERGPWLAADHTAEYLALPSPEAVRELERRGVLPGHRLGGSLRFSRPEIDALLLENRQATVNEIAEGASVAWPTIPPEGLGPLMGPEQAAFYLGLSTDALNHRVRRGELPCYRIGKQLRFRAVELDAAMKDERRAGSRRLSAAERQLTLDDSLLTPEGRRPFAEGKGGK